MVVPQGYPKPCASMTETRSSPIPHLLMAGLLLLALGWVYGAAVLDHGYVYDDFKLIETNPRLLTFWGPLQNWADPLWSFAPGVEPRPTGFWRPFTLQVLAAARWMSDGEAWGPHLASFLIHVLACFAALRWMLRLGWSFWLAWGVTFLFALHPVQVQSVAWAASINDPLIGLFALICWRAWLDWVDLRRISALLVAMGALALGLLSKEQGSGHRTDCRADAVVGSRPAALPSRPRRGPSGRCPTRLLGRARLRIRLLGGGACRERSWTSVWMTRAPGPFAGNCSEDSPRCCFGLWTWPFSTESDPRSPPGTPNTRSC